jgi:hypothetical protein
MADIENTLRSDMNVLVQNQMILREVEKIENWKGEAYSDGDDIELALEEIKRLIGNQKLYE